jgi:hypothetical protein
MKPLCSTSFDCLNSTEVVQELLQLAKMLLTNFPKLLSQRKIANVLAPTKNTLAAPFAVRTLKIKPQSCLVGTFSTKNASQSG